MRAPRRDDLDAVFLDAGNTLVTLDHALLAELLAADGVETTPAVLARAEAAARPALSRFVAAGGSSETRDAFTFHVRRILSAVGVEAPAQPALADRLVSTLRHEVGTMRLWSQLLPGVPEALGALRDAGLALVVVSNSDGTVERQLEQLALRSLLDAVVDSAVVGAEKPDPAIFRHALARAGVRPERALHVGDLYAVDVVGARRAGLHALLLDPFGDWGDEVDCPRSPDVPALARALLDGGGSW
jgi:putative hydrolase of the HAD superfamily